MRSTIKFAERCSLAGFASNWATSCFEVSKCCPESGRTIFCESHCESLIYFTWTKTQPFARRAGLIKVNKCWCENKEQPCESEGMAFAASAHRWMLILESEREVLMQANQCGDQGNADKPAKSRIVRLGLFAHRLFVSASFDAG